MSLADKMRGLGGSVQDGIKTTSTSIIHVTLRALTGFFLGLTLGLIGQQLIGYGSFGLIFFMVVMMGLVLKALSRWSIAHILVFDLICVLVAALLRMYILVAP